MAKGKNDIDFDDGLDDFDFDFTDDDFSFTPPTDDRKPIVRVGAGVLEGVKNELTSPDQIRRRTLAILPEEYGEAANLANSVVDTGRNLYNTASNELRPAIKEAKRTVQRFMPKVRDFIPKKYADKLDDLTKEEPATKGPTVDDVRNSQVDQTLADIFKVQMASDAENREREGVDKQLQRKTEERRYKNELAALNNIATGVNRQVAYQDQVTAKYQRLSLELQFRQTYLLADTFELAKATALDQKTMMADIVKNTGLPETEKVHLTEQAAHQFKQGLISAGQNKLAQWRKDLFPNMGKNLDRVVKQNAGDFRDRILGVTSQLDMLGGDDGPALDGANVAGSTIGGLAGGWLTDKAAKALKPIVGENQWIKNGANKLGYEMTRLPAWLSDLAGNVDPNDKSWKGALKRLGAEIVGPYSINANTGPNPLEQARERVEFDDLSRRSLTEIIPGYLSRIHHELAIIRTGDASLDRTVYNLDRGEFTGFKQSALDASSRLISDKSVANTSDNLDKLVKEIDPEDALTPAARKALRERLLKTAGSGKDFSVGQLASEQFWDGAVSAEDQEQLIKHFMERYGLESETYEDANGLTQTRTVNKEGAVTLANRAAYGKRIKALLKDLPEPTDAIRSYMNVGQIEQLKALGLVTTEGTQHRIDQNRIWSRLQGGMLDVNNPETNPDTVNPLVRNPGPPAPGPGPDGLRDPADNPPPVPPAGDPVPPPPPVIPPSLGPDLQRLIDAYEAGNQTLVQSIVANRLKDETDQGNETLQKILALLESGQLFVQTGAGGGPGPGDPSRFDSLGGWAKRGFKWGAGKVGGAGKAIWGFQKGQARLAMAGFNKARDFGGRAWGWLRGKKDDVAEQAKTQVEKLKDLYIKGELWPAITAKGLAAGEYFDALTGEAITKFEDIKGPVKDKLGNIVLDTKDYAKGFMDAKGKPFVLKAWDKLKGVAGAAAGLVAAPYRMAFNIARKGFDKFKAFIERPRDLYILGEENPRLLATVMEAGGYFDKASGQPIKSWKDIRGAVVDSEGNVVLTLEDLRKGMVDAAGKTLKSFGGWAVEKAISLATAPWRMAKRVVGSGIKLGRKMLGGMGRMFKGLGSKLKLPTLGGSNEMMETIGEYQILLLEEIRDSIRDLRPKRVKYDQDGDGVREGSYADWLKRKPKKEKKEASKGKEEEKSPSWIGRMGMMLAGVLGKGISTIKDLFGGFLKSKAISGILSAAGSVLGGAGGLLGRGAGALGRGAWAATKFAGRMTGGALGLAGRAAMWGATTALPAVGGALLTGASAIGSGLLAAGTAVAGVMSAPVMLGIGAAALVGMGAYWLYKKYDASKDRPLRKLRLAQYGVSYADEDQAKKVLTLEDYLSKNVKYGSDGATLDESKLDIPKLLEGFGFGEGDDQAIDQFSQWYNARFKRIYLTHCTALHSMAGNVALEDVDEDLPLNLKLTYINATKFSGDGDSPYAMQVSPFGLDSKLTATLADINNAEREAIEKIKAAIDKKDGKGAGQLAEDTAEPTAVPAGQGTFEDTAFIASVGAGLAGERRHALASAAADAGKVSLGTAAATTAGFMALAGGDLSSELARTQVDAITAVRYRAYGLRTMEYDKVNNLDRLENAAGKDIKYNTDRVAVFNGNPETYFQEFGGRFGVSSSNAQGYADWMVWFKSRFLPVLLNLYTAVRTLSSSTNPFNAYKELTNAQLLGLVEAMSAAKGRFGNSEVSVWTIKTSPWPDYALNLDADSIRPNVDALKEGVSASTYNEQTGKGTSQTDLNKVAEDLKAAGLIKGPGSLAADTTTPAYFQPGQYTSAANSSGGPNYGALSVAGGNGGSLAGGMQVLHQGAGSGGDINSLPMSKGDGSWDAHKDVIVGAAKMVGVDPALMATMASLESGFRAGIKAKGSSATGLFQFISGTWQAMLNKYGSKYGINPNTPATDPRANALMGAEYIKENQRILEKVLGRPATDTDIYMAHFLGAGGASKFLKLNPNANAVQAMPKAAAANKSIFFGPNGVPRSVAEVYNVMDNKVKTGRNSYGDAARTLGGLTTVSASQAAAPAANDSKGGGLTPVSYSPSGEPLAPTPGVSGQQPTVGSTGGASLTPILSSNGQVSAASMMQAPGSDARTATPSMIPSSQPPAGPAGASAQPAAAAGGELMKLVLQREPSTDAGTFGKLLLPDGTSFDTLELAWRDNASGKSCIPNGVYPVETRNSPKFGPGVYEVKKVQGRSAILIHAGNTAGNVDKGQRSDVQGCILLGTGRSKTGTGQPMVTGSRAAIAAFTAKMAGRPFILTVVGAAAPPGDSTAQASTSAGSPAAATQAPLSEATGSTPTPPPSNLNAAFAPSIDSSAGLSTAMNPTDQAVAERKAQVGQEARQTQLQTEESSKALNSGVSGMVEIMSKQLEVQLSMDATLKNIESGINRLAEAGGSPEQSGPAKPQRVDQPTPIRGNRAGVVQASKLPVDMKRAVS